MDLIVEAGRLRVDPLASEQVDKVGLDVHEALDAR